MAIVVLFIISVIVGLFIGLIQYRKNIFGSTYTSSNSLKIQGVPFPIPTNSVIIKSREYWEDEEIVATKTTILDSFYRGSKDVPKQRKVISVFIYEGERNGKPVRYISQSINKDESTLRAILSKIKSQIIYIDPQDENNYYFDISPFF